MTSIEDATHPDTALQLPFERDSVLQDLADVRSSCASRRRSCA